MNRVARVFLTRLRDESMWELWGSRSLFYGPDRPAAIYLPAWRVPASLPGAPSSG
jgi:hypothetical protein